MIKTHLATTEEEKSLVFAARHAAYCMPVQDRPPLMECPVGQAHLPHDEFDLAPETRLYYVTCNDVPAGSARLIAPTPNLGLQIQCFFDAFPPTVDLASSMEPSRLSLVPSLRGRTNRRLALMSLLSAMCLDSIDLGCTFWVATLRGNVLLLLSQLMMPFSFLSSKPVLAEGTQSGAPLSGEPLFPVSIDLLETATSMYAFSFEAYTQIYRTDKPIASYSLEQTVGFKHRIECNIARVNRTLR